MFWPSNNILSVFSRTDEEHTNQQKSMTHIGYAEEIGCKIRELNSSKVDKLLTVELDAYIAFREIMSFNDCKSKLKIQVPRFARNLE